MPHFPETGAAALRSLTLQPKESTAESTQQDTRIRTKNRRKHYLDSHPEYYKRDDLELADPLLYDRLVRRFMSTPEREKEGRERGYTGVLEADLVRSEAKIEALQHPDPNSPMTYRRAPNGSIVGVEAEDEKVQDKEEGWRIWVDYQTQRFLRGEDQNFDYSAVDQNDEYDDRAEEDRSRLEQYFAEEDAQYVGEGTPKGETGIQDF